jgi:hypothetical protein
MALDCCSGCVSDEEQDDEMDAEVVDMIMSSCSLVLLDL